MLFLSVEGLPACTRIHQYGCLPGAAPAPPHSDPSALQAPMYLGKTQESQSGLREQMLGWGREEDPRSGHVDAPGLGRCWPRWVFDPTLKCFVATACKMAEAKILLGAALCIHLVSLVRQIWTLAKKKRYRQIITEQFKICDCSWTMLSCKSSICDHLPDF